MRGKLRAALTPQHLPCKGMQDGRWWVEAEHPPQIKGVAEPELTAVLHAQADGLLSMVCASWLPSQRKTGMSEGTDPKHSGHFISRTFTSLAKNLRLALERKPDPMCLNLQGEKYTSVASCTAENIYGIFL